MTGIYIFLLLKNCGSCGENWYELNNTVFEGFGYSFRLVVHMQFLVNIANMTADGIDTDE
jgi:hypothetical protein